ncbi:hypothetical protein A0H81_05406 [Grifola frondosa]|uniref:Uncharacterized protein n=1 Tax=Grifola frondosa TaxID=5627 RepID=A0A1C7MCJ3_GRIFR|nr:hypothetical protein A0H81_05406 [Grifola frondosa]
MEELREYCVGEGKDMSRYAVHTARRVEDLNELKASLAIGLREDRDDAIPLVYAPVPSTPPWEEDEDQSESEEEELLQPAEVKDTAFGASPKKRQVSAIDQNEDVPSRPTPSSPPLPLSPISNPSTPARKRPRTASWHPPPYIPDFLPPFPTNSPRHTPTPPPQDVQSSPVKVERPPSPPLPSQISTISSSADYLTPVPYAVSTLSVAPPWHLPSMPPSFSGTSALTTSRLSVPQTQPALLGAYHHILTHPPPAQVTSVNPSRYRVALALVAQSEIHPRWDPPTTLFSSAAPNPPRVVPIGPSYAVPINKGPPTPSEVKGEKEQDVEKERKLLPPAPPRAVAPCERISPLISQQSSRIPKLTRQMLPDYSSDTPPVLQRGAQKLTYGPGVNAPWNTGTSPTPAATPVPVKGKDSANGLPNGKDATAPSKPLPDARYYATWSYEQKHFDQPLMVRRGRMGSVQTLGPLPGRARSESTNA